MLTHLKILGSLYSNSVFLFLSADAIDVHSLHVCLPNDKKKDEEDPSNVNGHLIPSSNPHLSVINKLQCIKFKRVDKCQQL